MMPTDQGDSKSKNDHYRLTYELAAKRMKTEQDLPNDYKPKFSLGELGGVTNAPLWGNKTSWLYFSEARATSQLFYVHLINGLL